MKIKTCTDEQLVNKWKQTGFYDFGLLSPQEQIDLSAHLEEIIFSLSSKPNDVILETLRERCITWVHSNKIT